MTNDLRKKIDYSIALLRKAEALALRFDPDDGFFLAFSGGLTNLTNKATRHTGRR